MKLLGILSFAVLTTAGAACAQQSSAIDTQLAENLDFRDVRFRTCFGETVCEVDRYRIIAWNRRSDAENWRGAILYWDPVDGLGIQGGGQDDEIDYNERLIVEFPFQRNVYGVWLTDLFVGEVAHYGGSVNDGEQNGSDSIPASAETAGVEIRLKDVEPVGLVVSGDIALPVKPFNAMLAPELFSEGGDLRQRLQIRDGTISILSASLNASGDGWVLTSIPVNQLDEEKRDQIIGDDGVDVDLSALLGENLEVLLEPEGLRNADRISAILENQAMLGQLQSNARVYRTVGNVPNGEVSGDWQEAVPATSIMFHAPEGTSNDFSVAGVLFSAVSR